MKILSWLTIVTIALISTPTFAQEVYPWDQVQPKFKAKFCPLVDCSIIQSAEIDDGGIFGDGYITITLKSGAKGTARGETRPNAHPLTLQAYREAKLNEAITSLPLMLGKKNISIQGKFAKWGESTSVSVSYMTPNTNRITFTVHCQGKAGGVYDSVDETKKTLEGCK